MSSITGYNDATPADDGTRTEANKVTYASITTNLTDPIKDFVEANLPLRNTAASAPTATDDSADGYQVGSLWDDTAASITYLCRDATAGAAVWEPILTNIVEDTTPQLGGQLDVNGNSIGDGTNELLSFSETVSAVNEITITNASTGNAPSLSATGDDTNIDLNLSGKGTGAVKGLSILDTEQATTSGTSFTFTSPSSNPVAFDVLLAGVSLSGTDYILIQLADSGGTETSGYSGAGSNVVGASTGSQSGTAGFVLRMASSTSTIMQGIIRLVLKNTSTNQWIAGGSLGLSNIAGNATVGGAKTLSSTLTSVVVTRSGTDTFDSGSINVRWYY